MLALSFHDLFRRLPYSRCWSYLVTELQSSYANEDKVYGRPYLLGFTMPLQELPQNAAV